MSEYLLFQLWGPMASWGGIAIGEERTIEPAPTKSALIGIVAAALGIPRSDESHQAKLAAGYLVGVRVDRAGTLLRDFHTAQVPSEIAVRRRPARMRREEIEALEERVRDVGSSEGTIVSYREYWMGGAWTIALAARSGAPFDLRSVAAALHRPRFAPYLGRRSCPLGLPIEAAVIEAPDVLTAFQKVPPLVPERISGKPGGERDRGSRFDVFLDEDLAVPSAARAKLVRWDQPLSRHRWQFAPRVVVECDWELEAPDVLQ